jgi:uncharacterized protein (TIGR00369 family)
VDIRNPDYRDAVERVFNEAPFVNDVGIRLIDVGHGWVETELNIEVKHRQHGGFVHAGVQATIADHTAGAAATSLLGADEYVLSMEFKINLLRAARGKSLRCRAEVIKPGRSFSMIRSDVWCESQDGEKHTAHAVLTMAVCPNKTNG